MIDEEPKAELPIGEAKKLGELAREKWDEHLLLFSQVKNTVLEVNPNVNLPFNLEKGKSSSLGLFAEAAFREKPGKFPKGKHALEVWPKAHRRSAILGRVIFNDEEGRIYRDIDLKGIGSIESSPLTGKATLLAPGEKLVVGGRRGLLDKHTADYDYQKSEKFLLTGIRTCRVIAIIELKELVINQHKLSILKTVERSIIDDKFQPVVEVRAFGTKVRIADLRTNQEQRELLLEDAKKLVSQELGYKKLISTEEYLGWFAKTLGTNVGLMHKNGWYHCYLRWGHNITLDCRIVDLDSLSELKNEGQRCDDYMAARDEIRDLVWLFKEKALFEKKFTGAFMEAYDSVFPEKERKHYFRSQRK